MSVVKALSAALPTKSGCLFLLLLGSLVGALAYGIFWTLMNIPEGSESPVMESALQPKSK